MLGALGLELRGGRGRGFLALLKALDLAPLALCVAPVAGRGLSLLLDEGGLGRLEPFDYVLKVAGLLGLRATRKRQRC